MNKVVHVAVSNVYKNSTYKSEITNQALLGEQVEILDSENDFDYIKQEDGYEGWIKNNQLSDFTNQNYDLRTVRSHVIRIYENPDKESLQIRDAVIGAQLNIIDERQDWYQVLLPDGIKSWAQKMHFEKFPKLSRSNVVKLALEFLGYPYFWGGRSPRGLDCSGFTQTVFGLLGKKLPRDSYMQRDALKEISKNSEDAREGDLFFFGDDKTKVDHVGIALGRNKIIHARGMVRINSMDSSAANYNEKLEKTLITVSSVFGNV